VATRKEFSLKEHGGKCEVGGGASAALWSQMHFD
jgi:hypothetical protein